MRREKALVFEDNPRDIDALRRGLESAGYEVVHADTPESFRGYAPYQGYAIVIIDFIFGEWPGGQPIGVKLAEEVKKADRHTPVMLATDFTLTPSIIADAFHAGADYYVDKSKLFQDVSGAIKETIAKTNVSAEERQEEEFPLPIAFPLRDFRHSHVSARRSFSRMIELFEVTLKLVTYILMSAHRARLREHLPDDLRQRLARPSLGHYANVLNRLPECEGFLNSLSAVTRRKQFRRLCNTFIELRNDHIGHGVPQAESEYKTLLATHKDDIAELLLLLHPLRHWKIIRPYRMLLLDDGENEYEVQIFQGANPAPTWSRLRANIEIRPSEHVHLVNEGVTEYVDLYPWCQFLACEQKCNNEKLFLYISAHEGEIWGLDHVYGHRVQTRRGWKEVRDLIAPTPSPRPSESESDTVD